MAFGSLERAVVHRSNPRKRAWTKEVTMVSLEENAFDQGAFRIAIKAYLKDSDQLYVCKFAKDPSTPRMLYFREVEMQTYASIWADTFNESKNIDAPILFVECFVLEFVDRPGRPVCGCEMFIEGKFTKHNNNVGAVCSVGNASHRTLVEHDIAQAFSHFTFEKSNKTILICDIQGVGLQYTDPQIHTSDGKQFGAGNLGETGMRAFLLRHQCNDICSALELNPINPHSMKKGMSSIPFQTSSSTNKRTKNSVNMSHNLFSKHLEEHLDENDLNDTLDSNYDIQEKHLEDKSYQYEKIKKNQDVKLFIEEKSQNEDANTFEQSNDSIDFSLLLESPQVANHNKQKFEIDYGIQEKERQIQRSKDYRKESNIKDRRYMHVGKRSEGSHAEGSLRPIRKKSVPTQKRNVGLSAEDEKLLDKFF